MAHQFASQSTDSFRVLLDHSGGSLVVSTYQTGQLVLVRAQEKGVNTHFIGFGKPMGLAWKPGELSVGGAARVVTYRNLPAVAAKLGEADHADACYLMRGTYTTGAIDIHEMGYDADGELWFINTRMSCLCNRSPDYSFVPRWRPPFITEYELSDRCHLNGLGFRDGKPRYVSMLGRTDTGGGWRQNKTSGGLVMDIETNKVLADQLCMPHSPRWYRDKLWCVGDRPGNRRDRRDRRRRRNLSVRSRARRRSAGSCGTGDINVSVDIPAGDAVVFTLMATVDGAFDGEFITNTVTANAPDGIDEINPGDNTASDTNATDLVFADSFEETVLVKSFAARSATVSRDFIVGRLPDAGQRPVAVLRAQDRGEATLRPALVHARRFDGGIQLRISRLEDGQWVIGEWTPMVGERAEMRW